jgi:di/tricarboxylate transporter
MANRQRTLVSRVATIGLVAALWWSSPPGELTVQTWRLFAIFAGAIFSVVVGALPILTASVFSLPAAVLTGVLRPQDAYAGFANGTIVLIVVAFLVASAVVGSDGRRSGCRTRSFCSTR